MQRKRDINILTDYLPRERLRVARKNILGKTQAEFAKELNITQAAWNRVETGKNNLTVENLKLISIKHGIYTDWVLHGKGEVLDWKKIQHNSQWNRLFILRRRLIHFGGAQLQVAERLNVDLETYQQWELGLEEIPEEIVDRIYSMVHTHIRKEWWYEGKGEMKKENPGKPEKTEPGDIVTTINLQGKPSAPFKTHAEEIEDLIDHAVHQNVLKYREAFGILLKDKLREIGVLPDEPENKNQ
jgi:transcriptional regulator with XRE-family HTH domain